MKKLAMLAAGSSLVIGLSILPASATADVENNENQTCTITNTGADSVNTCTFDEEYLVTVVCTNEANISNINSQVADSGNVKVEGNTISGSASSGDAENINSFANELALGCGPANQVAVPVTPTAGGGGAAAPAAAAAAKVTALPKTGESDTAKNAGIVAAITMLLAGLSVAGLSLYRHRSLN